MEIISFSALTVGMVMIALLLGATPLDLVWNLNPGPQGDFVSCEKVGNADFCLPGGTWWGICRDKEVGRASLSLVKGSVTVKNSLAVFSGCPYYAALFTEAAFKANASKAVFASPGCMANDASAFVLGATAWLIQAKDDGLLRIARLPADGRSECDYLSGDIAWSPALSVPWSETNIPVGPTWGVELIGDLDGDGAPEAILHRRIKDVPLAKIGLLASIRSDVKVHGRTVTKPAVILATPEAKAVHAVEQAREACEHWGGEEGYDAARKKDIAASQKKDCDAYAKALADAQKRFPNNVRLKAPRRTQ